MIDLGNGANGKRKSKGNIMYVCQMKEDLSKNLRVGVLDVRMQITNKIYGRMQVRNTMHLLYKLCR